MTPPADTFWTHSRTRQLIDLYREGVIPSKIATLFGVTQNSIKSKLSRMRQSDRLKGRRTEVAPRSGAGNDTLRQNLGPRWTSTYYLPKSNQKQLEKELASERERAELYYEELLACFADYADDVYEHHGPGPHYRDVSAWGGA